MSTFRRACLFAIALFVCAAAPASAARTASAVETPPVEAGRSVLNSPLDESSDARDGRIVSPTHGKSPNKALDFVRDVQPALTKSGCNMGACHGSFQGRGLLSLSLLGYDVPKDHQALFVHSRGRRANTAAPDESLLLKKATGRMPHGGGVRITAESECYRILRRYIAEGCRPPAIDDAGATRLSVVKIEVEPRELVLKAGESAVLSVQALWSDGVRRDVTPWALYDVREKQYAEVTLAGGVSALKAGRTAATVRYMGQVAAVPVTIPYETVPDAKSPPAGDFTARNFIDDIVANEWSKLGLTPVETCSDGEFLRRASLDLTGTLPSLEETRAFLASTEAHKRSRLIDDLLERPEYVDYWSLKWGDLLRVHRRYVGEKGLESFSGWVRRAVRENRPLDVMTRELLTAQGNLYTSGPVAYYIVDQKPEELAETTSQIFLGVRMQCTKCHHHPLEVWSQDDYYGLAAFFTKLETKENKDNGLFGGARIVKVAATTPKGRTLEMDAEPHLLDREMKLDGVADVRTVLADAITAKDNPYFARNFANRYWAYLVCRGLVEPIDDVRATNPPTMPALLDALAAEFTRHDFDVKHLLRTICNSAVYQRASRVKAGPTENGDFYTHRMPKRMPAEALLDAVNRAVGATDSYEGVPDGTRAIALADPSIKSYFLDVFGRPARNSGCECARGGMPDLSQALHLANGAGLHEKITRDNGRLGKLLKAGKSRSAVIDELYLVTLTRLPTDDERSTIDELLTDAPSEAEGLQDLLWTLLNCTEFQFNH